jgi:hypothetical protein
MGKQNLVHPRHHSTLACSRRAFLPALLREAAVTLGMLRGGQGGRLSELGDLPDEQLAQLKPILNPAYEILVEEDCVWGRYKDTGTVVKLFGLEAKENLLAFNLFDGKHSLGQIGKRLAQEMGWDEVRGFLQARDLFLFSASRLVFVPNDPPLSMEIDLDRAQEQDGS